MMQPEIGRMIGSTIVTAVLLASTPATGKTPAQLKSDLASMMPSGQKARLVWSQGGTWTAKANKALYVVDSDDGAIRMLTSTNVDAYNPQITTDGKRVVFGDNLSGGIFVINWDGTNQREVVKSRYCAEYWRNPADNSDWVIAGNNGVSRVNIDKPLEEVILWNKTPGIGPEDGCALSPDGKRLAGWFEGSSGWKAGIAAMPNGALTLSSFGGCGMGIAPDNSYDYFVHWGTGHHGIRIINGTTSKATINLTDSILKWAQAQSSVRENNCHDNSEFQDAKWTNNRDYVTFSMFNTNANPFLVRLSDKKWIHIYDNIGCTFTHGMDVVFFTPQAQQSLAPRIEPVTNLSALAGKSVEVKIAVTGSPLPTLSATGLPSGVSVVNGSVPSQSFTVSGTPTQTGSYAVTLTAKNAVGSDVTTFTVTVTSQNQAPSVSAGRDTTASMGSQFRLAGSATDDGVPSPLQTLWRVLSGPSGGATIALPAELRSIVTFTAAGVYKMELTANDGSITRKDTVQITVNQGVPFTVLAPAAGQRIAVGTTCRMQWQMNPVAAVVVELSTDQGKTWQYLVFESLYETSWEWKIPADMETSSTCLIKVSNYDQRSTQALSGVFSLVAPGTASVLPAGQRPAPARHAQESFSLTGRRVGYSSALTGVTAPGASVAAVGRDKKITLIRPRH